MKVLLQPDDGAGPLVTAINSATKTIQIVIFRFDHVAVEKALKAAISRGVLVHALIAHTNGEGEKSLRKLEMSLLEVGTTVARTADDLARYHDKMIIIDQRLLYVLGFNFTYLDIERSRSFGLMINNKRMVEEAIKLFEADVKRQPYSPGMPNFVVSPENSRSQLAAFLKGARKQLCIYDPKLTDPPMIRVLQERVKSGVEVKVIGRLGKRGAGIEVQKFPGKRLHVRAIIRDERDAFIGSQSLKKAELDSRRELGVIVRDPRVARRIHGTFEADWAQTELGKKEAKEAKKDEEHVA
ncbi:MAG TPA: phospholipase D-like domain-containing protein [Acidobacteriota bacterium]|jgi:phosphatidylserine/phosphatidylglycerophosphate/cardiolipin synthase-like enzyme|nr:phospholipase D-like domain-containing protein [Acidobacteriota bacterium]